MDDYKFGKSLWHTGGFQRQRSGWKLLSQSNKSVNAQNYCVATNQRIWNERDETRKNKPQATALTIDPRRYTKGHETPEKISDVAILDQNYLLLNYQE